MESQHTPPCRADLTLELIERHLGKGNRLGRIAFPTGEGFDFIRILDIVYFQASGNYAIPVFPEGRKVLISRSLKEVEDLVYEYPFCRIHNGFLINMEHLVRYFRGDGGEVEMSNGAKLPVSRGRKEGLMRWVRSDF